MQDLSVALRSDDMASFPVGKQIPLTRRQPPLPTTPGPGGDRSAGEGGGDRGHGPADLVGHLHEQLVLAAERVHDVGLGGLQRRLETAAGGDSTDDGLAAAPATAAARSSSPSRVEVRPRRSAKSRSAKT